MAPRTTSIICKALAVTALATVATYAVFFLERAITGIPITSINLIECFVIPVVVGPPILCYLFHQSEKLKDAHRTLAELNEEAREAYRQLKLAHEIMAYTAAHDRMTGLPNRDRFIEHLQAAHSNREKDVLLLIDADHFKQINDRLGHLRGDDALVEIARAIRSSVRHGDVVGRIGGEEFGVLLKDMTLSRALDMAEKIRRQVEAIPWQTSAQDVRGLSVSIGAAALGEETPTVSSILEQADRCLYAAKRSGRNRVAFDHPLEKVA